MGSKVASDIFQKMLDSVYIGLPGVTGIDDDMVIYGRNEEEHDRNLILFLETTRKNGPVLNRKKLQFKKEEVSLIIIIIIIYCLLVHGITVFFMFVHQPKP